MIRNEFSYSRFDETIRLIGLRIKRRRIKAGLTQKELAKKSGVSETTIVNLEKGTTKPTQYSLYKLSRVFGITIDQLVYKDIYL